MSLREQVARFFAKPKPDAAADLNTTASLQDRKVAGDKEREDERKIAVAIDAKQAELLRTHLTPELTPYGTQPKRPPSGDEARAQAEKLVTGKDRDDDPATKSKASVRMEPPEPGHDFAAKADPARPVRDVKQDGQGASGPMAAYEARALLQAEMVDDTTRAGPLEAEIITDPYIADITTLQAGHEVDADQADNPASWTREERVARVAAQVVLIEAEQASAVMTHTPGGGRTM